MDCPLCLKVFSDKRALKYHMDHNVCQNKVKFVCSRCDKIFTTLKALNYHTEHNVCDNKPKVERKKLCLRKTNDYQSMSKEQIIEKLSQTEIKLSHMEGKYASLKENPQNISNNIIVFPKEFGKEDMEYVRQKLGDVVGPLVKSHIFTSIPSLFNKIHNNQDMPEYHNVYSTSERSQYALISDGHIFKHQPKKTVIDQIIESKRSILKDYINSNGDQLGEKVLRKYERYQDLIDDDEDFRKNLEIEIGGMLLDMKSVIANDESTRKLLDKVNEGEFDLGVTE